MFFLCSKMISMNLEVLRRLARASRSASRGEAPRDYDFLVSFEPMPPLEHGRAYLALLEDVQEALDQPVDLIETEALRNQYFLRGIEADRVLYAA
jgi:uncharacterized protein